MKTYTDGKRQVNYGYNAENLRIYKTVNGEFTGYVWNGNSLAAETNDSTITNLYTYGADGITTAQINGTTSVYLKNIHGDVVGTTDENGTLQKSYRYDAFGNEQNPDENDPNPFRYCGEYFDSETDNIYLRNRYYSPNIGRFITEDPIRDGLNWYTYCGNNPIIWIDPLGLDAIIITSSEAAEGFGHTSALYQDENGSWYYTYWGNKAAAVIYIPDEYMGSLKDINQGIKNILNHYGYTDITDNYDRATYIVGDFTASLQAAYDDVDAAYPNAFSEGYHHFDETNGNFVYQGQNSPYNLISNNCFDRTYYSLSKGILIDGTSVATYMSENGFTEGLIPNNATEKIVQLFMNRSSTKGGAYSGIYNYAILYNAGDSSARVKRKGEYANAAIANWWK